MLKTLAMTTAAVVLSGGFAAAQTAPAPAPATQAAAADPTNAQIASWIAGRHGDVDDDGGATADAPVRDGRVHGVVGASIGSGGYRSAYGVATMPVGERGDVTVGISQEHLGGGNRSYGGPGYGGYGYGGDRRTLSIGVDLTGDHSRRCGSDAGGEARLGGFGSSLDPVCANRAPPDR